MGDAADGGADDVIEACKVLATVLPHTAALEEALIGAGVARTTVRSVKRISIVPRGKRFYGLSRAGPDAAGAYTGAAGRLKDGERDFLRARNVAESWAVAGRGSHPAIVDLQQAQSI